jgi:hypothetical protein
MIPKICSLQKTQAMLWKSLFFLFCCFHAAWSFGQGSGKESKADTAKPLVKVRRQKVDNELTRYQDSVIAARYKASHLDGRYIPMDLLDCFRNLDTLMDDGVRERFMAFSDEEVDKRTHGSLGKWLDNRWSISEGSRLTAYFRKMGVPHPDYMTGIIIRSYHRHLHKRDLKVKEQVNEFKKLWEQKELQRVKEQKAKDAAKKGAPTPKNQKQ